MKQIVRRAKAKAQTAVIGSALSLLGRPYLRRRAQERLKHAGLILMFHHVAPRRPDRLTINRGLEILPETLERILNSLKAQNYDIVPMDAVPERLSQGSSERRFAALTFDDGGRDNLIHAAPVLRRHEAPFTVYVTTNFTSGLSAPWWHVVERAVLAARALRIDAGQGMRFFDTSDHPAKNRAAEALHDILWRADDQMRARLTAELGAQSGLDLTALTRELCMDWNELRDIAALPGCALGAHTMTHANLAQLDEHAAMREISEARDEIRARLGVAVNHFAYPYGAPGCCEAREFELVRKAGFVTAVTTRRGVLACADIHRLTSLPRAPINGCYQHPPMVDALVSGLPFALAEQSRALMASIRNGVRRPVADEQSRASAPRLKPDHTGLTSQPAP